MNSLTANKFGTQLDQVQSAQLAHLIQPKTERSKWNLTMVNLIGGLAAFSLATFSLAGHPLHAGELSAMAAQSIHLGRFHGVVYYTSENDGYRVVATIADGEDGFPARFAVTLAEDQSATISLPGKLGEPTQSLEISRSGEKLTVTEVGSMSN
jgi:hypothetical protein